MESIVWYPESVSIFVSGVKHPLADTFRVENRTSANTAREIISCLFIYMRDAIIAAARMMLIPSIADAVTIPT